MKPRRTVETTGAGKRGKPNPGFPSLPTALGNRCAIPTFPPPRRCLHLNLKNPNPRKETLPADRLAPAFRLILQ
jgi:hypothetical protein